MTSKGQLTVPADVRRALGLRAGSKVSFLPEPDGSYRLVARTGSVRDLQGLLIAPRHVTLEEMDEAIAAGAAQTMGSDASGDRPGHERPDPLRRP